MYDLLAVAAVSFFTTVVVEAIHVFKLKESVAEAEAAQATDVYPHQNPPASPPHDGTPHRNAD